MKSPLYVATDLQLHFMLHEAIQLIQTKQIIEYMTKLCFLTNFIFFFKRNDEIFKTIARLGQFNVLHCHLKQSHHTAGFH